jgi:hypothetical protein
VIDNSTRPHPSDDPTFEEPSLAHRLERLARMVVPFLVSGALLAYVFSRIDIRLALDYLTLDVALRFLVPLILFNLFTVAIEAQCLHRVTAASPEEATALSRFTSARIKSACYLLGILNYALGAAGLSVLLRRRTGASLGTAAGMVFLISLFDIGSVLAWVGSGAAMLQADTFGLRLGIVSLAIGAIVSGFIFLRVPMSMGPLDAVRELDLFRAPRTAPTGLLIEIGLLRLLFVGCFVALARALFWAFDIEIGAISLMLNVGIMLVVSALPIAAGGLGTGQIIFVQIFSGVAPDAQLLSMSLVFSVGIIFTRALIGLVFAPEFTREALRAAGENPEPAPPIKAST